MKRVRYVFALLPAVCMLFSLAACGSASNTSDTSEDVSAVGENTTGETSGDPGPGNIAWTLEDGVLTISGSGRMEDYGYAIDDLAPWCGSDTAVTGVVIEPGVTSIGSYAFYSCKMLTQVSIPDSVTGIGDNAFNHCDNLVITIPESVTHIGSSAFNECRLTEVTIPASVTDIGMMAFYECRGLADVYYGGNGDQWAELSAGAAVEATAVIHSK